MNRFLLICAVGLPFISQAATLSSNQENTSFSVRERGRSDWTTVGNGKFVDHKLSPKSFYEVRAKAQGYNEKVMSIQGNLDHVQFFFMIGDKASSQPSNPSPVSTQGNPRTAKVETRTDSSKPAPPQASATSLSDAGKKIATALAKEVVKGPLKIGIDKFLYQGEDLTPFSSLLRKQLSVSLQSTGKFTEVVRDKISSLQNEKKFQQNSEISSGEAAQLKVDGAVAIVQGQFFSSNGIVTIQTSLVFLEGGREVTAQETVLESLAGARVAPKETPSVPTPGVGKPETK
jgi:hypothetical protein